MKKWISTLLFFFFTLVLHAQNVGIGIASPTRAKLEVYGVAGSGNTSAVFGSDAAGVSFQRGWPTIGFNQYRDNASGNGKFMAYGFGGFQHFDPATGTMGIDMMGGGQYEMSPATIKRALTFNYNGLVAVGNAWQNSSLTVDRGNSNATAYFFGTQHYSAFNFSPEQHTYIRAGLDGGTVFINDIPNAKVNMYGFVGINTATPGVPLEIRQSNGRGIALVEPSTFANWDFNVISGSSSANLYFNYGGGANKGHFNSSDGSYQSVSDARLKTAIENLPSLLDKYMQLRPVTYEMIHDNSQHEQSIGFLAQEVKQQFPELVSVTKDTARSYPGIADLHMLNYEGFGVLTIKAIQEQQAIMQQQKESIENLQEKLNALKKRLQDAPAHHPAHKQ